MTDHELQRKIDMVLNQLTTAGSEAAGTAAIARAAGNEAVAKNADLVAVLVRDAVSGLCQVWGGAGGERDREDNGTACPVLGGYCAEI